MPATPTFGFRYPAVTDAPNVPLDIGNLATDVETALTPINTLAQNSVQGWVGGASGSTDTTVTTTEAILLSCTFTAIAGRRYKFTGDMEYYQKTGTTGTNMVQNIRVIAGGTPTATGGTLVRAKHPNTGTSLFVTIPTTLVGTWVAPSSGTFAASLTVKSDSGTGGIAGGTDHTYELMVEDAS